MARSSTFRIAVRWAAWSPINNLRDAEHSVNLIGGPTPIPDRCFVYRDSPEIVGSSASVAGPSHGTVTFSFARVNRQVTV